MSIYPPGRAPGDPITAEWLWERIDALTERVNQAEIALMRLHRALESLSAEQRREIEKIHDSLDTIDTIQASSFMRYW